MVLWPVIAGAVKLYDIITTCQGAMDAYDEGGLPALAQYGLEEATMNLLMGSSMKIVGKMINKARGVVKETASSSYSGVKAAKDVPASEGKSSAKAAKESSRNVTNKVRLQTELGLKDAGILDKSGKLTPNTIKQAVEIEIIGGLKNPDVIRELTKDGSKISDWGKFKTRSIDLQSGQRIQVHFYLNKKTGIVDYNTSDFKVKGIVR